jgi:bifunctional non-homologous end joining protein LigD
MTSIAAYSTRARPHSPIAVPLSWSELLPAREPGRFTIGTVPARLARLRADPWMTFRRVQQRISAKAVQALEAM